MSTHALPLAPVTPARLTDLIARLPATARAQYQWAPTALLRALSRLETEELTPQVMHDVLAEVHRVFMQVWSVILPLGAPQVVPDTQNSHSGEIPNLGRLAPADQRKVVRTVLTLRWLTQWVLAHPLDRAALDASEASFASAGQMLTEPALAVFRALVWCVAVLHMLETGAVTSRTSEIATYADLESMAVAQQLSTDDNPHVRTRLPWYFEDTDGAAEYESVAAWAEPRLTVNDRASQLIHAWADDDVAEQTASWEAVKKALDEDRLSGRKLF